MTVRGKANAWKRVLSCFLALTLIIGTLTFTGNEAKVVHAADGTISITQTEAAWYSLSDRHVIFQYSLTDTEFSSGCNIINEDFIDQYISFAGGMTKADFMEGLTYGGIADAKYFQIKWGNRTEKFGSGWSFTIAQGTPIAYNDSAATATLDREYVFTFEDGGTNCANYCTPKGYYITTFTFDGAFENDEFGNGKSDPWTTQLYFTTEGMHTPTETAPSFVGDESYRDYISISGINFDDYEKEEIQLRYIINTNDKCIQFQQWGNLRTILKQGDQIIFYKGLPLYYTDTSGNACITRLAHTYVFECTTTSNADHAQVFRYMALDDTVPTYGLKTQTWESYKQSDTNLEQYINVQFTGDCQKSDSVNNDAMKELIAKEYIELSGYTSEEAKELGLAVRFIPSANVLQIGFSPAAVEALKVGTTLKLKKGMTVVYDISGLHAATLDADYVFTLTKKEGSKLFWENVLSGSYTLTGQEITQAEEGSYKMYAMPIVTDAFPDMKNINELNNRGQGRFTSWDCFRLSHHSTADLTADDSHLDWYGYNPTANPYYQGLRLYSNLEFADGETMTLEQGLPITYPTIDERSKTITLEKKFIWKWVKAENKWVITDKEAVNARSFDLTEIQVDTNANTDGWHLYLKPSVALADDENSNWADNYNIQISIDNAAPVTVNGMQASSHSAFLVIPYDVLAKDATATLTIKAGTYKSKNNEKYWQLNTDYTLYINKFGWSETGYIVGFDTVVPSIFLPKHANSTTKNGFTFALEEPDEAYVNGWEAADNLQPIGAKKVTDTTLYWALEQGGLYINGEFVSDVNATMFKLDKNSYYVPLSDYEKSGETGKTYQIKGYYMDKNGKIFHYESPVVKWTGSEWQTIDEGLKDTGVRYDVNADSKFNAKDLIRLMRYIAQPNDVKIAFAYADCNYDKEIDKKDVGAMRRLLLGTFSYKDGEATPYGTPVFDNTLTVERLAYVCPRVTKEDGTIFSEAEVDEVFSEFKKTGLTLLNTEFVAPLSDQATDHKSNNALRAYLRGAERNGLGVIVYSVYLEALLQCTGDIETQYPNWQVIMDVYVTYLNDFPAFRGFVMSDELRISQVSNYEKVATYLRAKYPELLLFSSQLATYAESYKIGDNYKDYIDAFALSSGVFTYDNYGLIEKTGNITGNLDYSVEDSWFNNLKQVAENSLDADGNQRYIPGVTIQSFSMPYSENTWHTYRRYATTEKADIGFQMYTAMAWGMQSVNYFSYGEHPDTANEGLGDEMLVNPDVKAAVTAANSDLATFEHVYKSFAWKNTLDVAKGKTVAATNNSRLTSVKAGNGRTFVGCMQDVYGFDGFMVANAEGPRTTGTVTVELKFTNATKAWVYYNGTKEEVNLTGGTYSKGLKAGEGMFVIPLR